MGGLFTGKRGAGVGLADEVQRLWNLNRDRIASGDPDMIMAGTELWLR
jgi:hypothetical protein